MNNDWDYRCGLAQGRAESLGNELQGHIDRMDKAMEKVRLLDVKPRVESEIVTTSAETPVLSDNKIIYLIRQTPRLSKRFSHLSVEGKRRVLQLANGSDFLLAETIEDVLEQERGH